MGSTGGDTGQQRAQSETLGFILAIGIIIVGALLVAGIGALALNETQEEISVSSAETELTQLDAKAGLVALGDADSQEVTFGESGVGEEFSIEEDNGRMEVVITNRTDESVETLMDTTLGALTWEGDDTRLAYQGGGVFRADAGGGQMVSPPEFHFRGATLTLPTVTVTGDAVLGNEVMVERVGESEAIRADNESNENPLDEHFVTVSVWSEFYEGWGHYFEERTDGNVNLYHDEERAELILTTPLHEVELDGALSGQSASGELNVQAQAHHPCGDAHIHGYDSSEGPVCGDNHGYDYTDGVDGTFDEDEYFSGGVIAYIDDIDFDSEGFIEVSHLIGGADIDIANNFDVHGDISYVGDCTAQGPGDCDDAIHDPGEPPAQQIDRFEGEPPIDRVNEVIFEELMESDDELDLEDDVIDDGEYYYEDDIILEEDDELIFDTSDGDVAIAIDGNIDLTNAEIVIKGDNHVDIHMIDSEDYDSPRFRMEESHLWVAGEGWEQGDPMNKTHKSEQFTLFGDRNLDVWILGASGQSSEFTGVVYAPPGENGEGELQIDGGVVFGGAVTGGVHLGEAGDGPDYSPKGTGGAILFDRQLEDTNLFGSSENIVELTFLHVSKNEIEITG